MKLNSNNFRMFAIQHYDNPQALDEDEFNRDMHLFTLIKRMLSLYNKNGELNERLLLNYVVTLYNLFGPLATSKMLFYYMPEEHYETLKTVLAFLGYLPEQIEEVDLDAIGYDYFLWDVLRDI